MSHRHFAFFVCLFVLHLPFLFLFRALPPHLASSCAPPTDPPPKFPPKFRAPQKIFDVSENNASENAETDAEAARPRVIRPGGRGCSKRGTSGPRPTAARSDNCVLREKEREREREEMRNPIVILVVVVALSAVAAQANQTFKGPHPHAEFEDEIGTCRQYVQSNAHWNHSTIWVSETFPRDRTYVSMNVTSERAGAVKVGDRRPRHPPSALAKPTRRLTLSSTRSSS